MTPEERKKTADKLRALADDLESGRWEAEGSINSTLLWAPTDEPSGRQVTVFLQGEIQP